jgi:hypothetical protein
MLDPEKKIKDIMAYFSWLDSLVDLNNSFSFTDINISLETLIMKLLNMLEVGNYENCNIKRNNYPVIDLIDETQKIGIQITAEKTASKIKETLKKNQGVKLKFFILGSDYKPRQKTFLAFSDFKVVEDILNFKYLLKLLRKDERKIDDVLKLLNQNIIFPIDPGALLKFCDGYDEYTKSTVLNDILNSCENFVPTGITYKCLRHLEQKNLLILIGNPGVGKSYNSKFIVARHLELGYKLLYSPNKSLKDILNSYNQKEKFIMFLDDIFGSNNVDFMDFLTDSEIVSLLLNEKNNLKIVINSRTSIFKDVNNQFDKISRLGLKPFIIKTNDFSSTEKARILIKHLQISKISSINKRKLFECAKWTVFGAPKQLNIYHIIYHRNFNPRLIEFITHADNYDLKEDYVEFVIRNLDNPQEIYEHTYNNNLIEIDKAIIKAIFLKSIYKTNYEVECEKLVKTILKLNFTEDEFYISLKKLEQSFISIYKNEFGIDVCKFYNPSILDYCIKKFANSADMTSYAEICDNPDEIDGFIANERVGYELKKRKIIELEYKNIGKLRELKKNIKTDAELKEYVKQVVFDPNRTSWGYEGDSFCDDDIFNEKEIVEFLKETNEKIILYVSLGSFGPSRAITKVIFKHLSEFDDNQFQKIIEGVVDEINGEIFSKLNDYIDEQESIASCVEEQLRELHYEIQEDILSDFEEYLEEKRVGCKNLVEGIRSNLFDFEISDYEEYIEAVFKESDSIDTNSEEDKETIKLIEAFYASFEG